jgi:tRNA A22 N-methylase
MGIEIGLDNTCKSVYSLQEFFGLAGANEQKTALGELRRYKEALEFDLKHLSASEAKKLKEERLHQINTYLALLNQMKNDKQIVKPLHLAYPLYPAPVEKLMKAKDANLYTVILRPKEQDILLRTTAISPVFSANHSVMVNDQIIEKHSLLYEVLASSYQELELKPKSKEQLIRQVLSKPNNNSLEFEQIGTVLSQEIRAYLGMEVSFDKTQGSRLAPSVAVNKKYMDNQLAVDADNPATNEEYIRALLEYCAPNLFVIVDGSPFYSIDTEERLCILTQFFLAELNVACYAKGTTKANWGAILEGHFDLIKGLAEVVKKALGQSNRAEEALIDYVNQHHQAFQLTSPIPKDDIPSLKARFQSHYELIKGSPHFDEFMLLSDQKGLFVAHQNCMGTHFAQLLQTGFFNKLIDEPTKVFLQKIKNDFETIEKPDNKIPHQNDHIAAEMNEVALDLAPMDKNALQVLYEEINTYSEPKLKESLLIQLYQERPDFKPQINAKDFLQKVAYGQQKEAEELLKKDWQMAQELLKADNTVFTDYSGRTFTCTAYEYAYWARDSHMQRMLEKYIRKDEGTRLFTLKRVQAIEELVNPPAASNFFEQPEPRGLHYTTKDAQGQTIDHWEAHFDLTPLKRALLHLLEEYNKKPVLDWEALDKIWVNEIGRAQREVPAHIAQEYCHPNRNFEYVTWHKSCLEAANPNNLIRTLKFFNLVTEDDDFWFTPDSYSLNVGLGFSFAIHRMRGIGNAGGELVFRCSEADEIMIELTAITTIDEQRTKDLKQSLDNLSQPLITRKRARNLIY